ncbi:MAG: hypothetical protein HY332_06570 [Chloroflexi bacterium]|nr:hypothetical protein [Chloroflexota bacterium]
MRIRAVNFFPARLGEGKTLPQVFQCDDGRFWVLKLPGSPGAAPWELCADWIGTALAGMAKAPVLECGLVQVGLDAIWTLPDGPAQWAKPGTAFGTVFLEQARPVTGSTVIEHGLSPLNRMRIVATDTWLDVLDRQKPQRGGWNLLEDTSGETPRVVAIDYGMGLTEVLSIVLAPPSMESRVPEAWRPSLREEDISAAVADIRALSAEPIQHVVDAVPEDWRLGVPGLGKVPAYLLQRQTALDACLRKGLGP